MNVSLSSGVVNCKSLRNVFLSHHCSGNLGKIKSDSLKVLKIHQRGGTWEIDAPNLVSLDYMGNQIPELKIARESTQLEHSEITLQCLSNLNAAWF
ncbi:hypothetical protein MTR67_040865, partial [Solanum verrucosum]